MNKHTQNIQEYKKARLEFLAIIKDFPEDKKTEKLIEGLSIKDIAAITCYWDLITVDTLSDLINENEPAPLPNMEGLHDSIIEENKDLSWDEVYENLVEAGSQVIESYKSLPEDLWDKQFWDDKEYTPAKYLEYEIHNYNQEFLPKIKALLE